MRSIALGTLNRRASRRIALACTPISLLALPALCLWLTPNPIAVAGYIDTFLYTAYMINLRHLVERYDVTYYMLRMAAILPGRGIYHLVGPEIGFLVLHYLQILVGCTALFLIARRFYGSWVAWLSVILLCFSPWYLRSETWDYVDGFALNYLFAAFACALVPRRYPVLWLSSAGAFAALATNSNLYTLCIWASFFPAWLIINRFQSWRAVGSRVMAFVAGFIAAYAGLAYAVNSVRPGLGPFFELFTVHVAEGLLSGGSASWFVPLDRFLAGGYYYVLTPVAIAIGALILLARTNPTHRLSEETRLTAAFSLYLVIVIGIYLVSHYVFHSPRITLFYYFCYLIIPSHLTLTAIIGQLAASKSTNTRLLLSIAMAATVALWKAYGISQLYNHIPFAVAAVLFIIFVIGTALGFRFATLSLACVLLFAVAIPGFFFRSSDYSVLLHGDQRDLQRDVYNGAFHLVATVEKISPPSLGPVAFWYSANNRLLGSVQSAFLYGYSRLNLKSPISSEKLRSEIEQTRTLVVLASNFTEVDRTLVTLHQAGIRTSTLLRSFFRGHVWSYVEAIVRVLPLAPRHGAALATVPLASLRLVSKLAPRPYSSGGSLHFRTDPRQWAYTLQADLTHELSHAKRAVAICVTAQSLSGAIGLLLTKKSDISSVLDEKEVMPTGQFDEYCMYADPRQVGDFIVRNRSAAGPSEAAIRSITVDNSK